MTCKNMNYLLAVMQFSMSKFSSSPWRPWTSQYSHILQTFHLLWLIRVILQLGKNEIAGLKLLIRSMQLDLNAGLYQKGRQPRCSVAVNHRQRLPQQKCSPSLGLGRRWTVCTTLVGQTKGGAHCRTGGALSPRQPPRLNTANAPNKLQSNLMIMCVSAHDISSVPQIVLILS